MFARTCSPFRSFAGCVIHSAYHLSGHAAAADVYNAFSGLVNPAVPNKLFSSVNPLDANAAAKAFYQFKDVVKAAQR